MEKRVAPILVIIVLFIALLSTYAWFSDSMTASLILDMESGTPTVVVLGTGTAKSKKEAEQKAAKSAFEKEANI